MKVVLIGGGAAGFFSAINIAEERPDAEVIILEKTSKLLSKVKVSGGGRCNVTHACFDPKELTTHYPRGEKELLSPFHQFMTGDTIAWFAERGIELKMEEDGRMFPISDSSQTIIDCFLQATKKLNIKIETNSSVTSISRLSDKFQLSLNNGRKIECDVLVAANGGSPKKSHYQLYEDLGHSILNPIPSLFTFNLPKHASNELMGLAVSAEVKLSNTNFETFGPVLFTHWGMSGPAILKLSAMAADYLHRKSYQFEYSITWISNANEFISAQRKESGKVKLKNSRLERVPKRVYYYLLNRANINSEKNWADLNKSEIERLENVLEADLYKANGKTTFKEEFVTCGGIELKEVNMKTYESKLVPNLFFAGEILNIDAVTGGFNFQAAWTSGYIVARTLASR